MPVIEHCPQSEDGTHCVHWWDDAAPCCYCGDDTLPEHSDTRDADGNRITEDAVSCIDAALDAS